MRSPSSKAPARVRLYVTRINVGPPGVASVSTPGNGLSQPAPGRALTSPSNSGRRPRPRGGRSRRGTVRARRRASGSQAARRISPLVRLKNVVKPVACGPSIGGQFPARQGVVTRTPLAPSIEGFDIASRPPNQSGLPNRNLPCLAPMGPCMIFDPAGRGQIGECDSRAEFARLVFPRRPSVLFRLACLDSTP